jgi:hypothetical protein
MSVISTGNLRLIFFVVQVGDLGNNGINLGFATFGTDTGHQSTTNDGSWGLNNPVRTLDGNKLGYADPLYRKVSSTLATELCTSALLWRSSSRHSTTESQRINRITSAAVRVDGKGVLFHPTKPISMLM